MRTIKPRQLPLFISQCARAGQPMMLWGSPGVGKSQIIKQQAQHFGAKLWDIRANLFEPVDVRGGLKVVQENDQWVTRYGRPEDFPPSNDMGKHWLVLEEITIAPQSTQNALLQLIELGRVGAYTLPTDSFIIACGNGAGDRANYREMPDPVKTRMQHFELVPDIDDLVAYAYRNIWDSRIISYLRFRPSNMVNMPAGQKALACPRTWEKLNNMLPFIDVEKEDELFITAQSCVGEGIAGEFVTFCRNLADHPDLDNVIAYPSQAKLPTTASVTYAVVGALVARTDLSNFSNVVKYIRRLGKEYQVYYMRDVFASTNNKGALLASDAFKEWNIENSDVMG